MTPEQIARLLQEFGRADDARLTIGGCGDPLESELLSGVIEQAKASGIRAIHVQTDLLSDDLARIERLAESAVDVVSVQIPAVTSQTYEAVMGLDRLKHVLGNVARFLEARQRAGRGAPLLIPVFVKCALNMPEMEKWYDQWLHAVGCAVIEGPSDYSGKIPSIDVADLSPPKRGACARLASRLTVLSDGCIVACEQDVQGASPLGRIGQQALGESWTTGLASLRKAHDAGRWAESPLCASCKQWHRS
jgi:hypothetical protein